MNKVNLPLLLSLTSIVLLILFSVYRVHSVRSATATHVVISEVQISGSSDADDEFVEVYNPTNSVVDLTGWRLTRKTSTGTQSNLVASMSGSLASHSYFLIAPSPDYLGSTVQDLNYSTTSRLAASNTVLLYSDAGITLVDKVGLGTATDNETSAFATNPTAGQSIERKANSSSDATSMGSGGTDEFLGNGEDTDNNSTDFVLRVASQPQNSSSVIEPTASLSPSATPAESPSPSPEESVSPSPSASPSESPAASPSPSASPEPSPSQSPSPAPSTSPSPSPEISPSPSPVLSPSPSLSPSPTPISSPSATPQPSPTPNPTPISSPSSGALNFPFFTISCSIDVRAFGLGFFKFQYPRYSCRFVRI